MLNKQFIKEHINLRLLVDIFFTIVAILSSIWVYLAGNGYNINISRSDANLGIELQYDKWEVLDILSDPSGTNIHIEGFSLNPVYTTDINSSLFGRKTTPEMTRVKKGSEYKLLFTRKGYFDYKEKVNIYYDGIGYINANMLLQEPKKVNDEKYNEDLNSYITNLIAEQINYKIIKSDKYRHIIARVDNSTNSIIITILDKNSTISTTIGMSALFTKNIYYTLPESLQGQDINTYLSDIFFNEGLLILHNKDIKNKILIGYVDYNILEAASNIELIETTEESHLNTINKDRRVSMLLDQSKPTIIFENEVGLVSIQLNHNQKKVEEKVIWSSDNGEFIWSVDNSIINIYTLSPDYVGELKRRYYKPYSFDLSGKEIENSGIPIIFFSEKMEENSLKKGWNNFKISSYSVGLVGKPLDVRYSLDKKSVYYLTEQYFYQYDIETDTFWSYALPIKLSINKSPTIEFIYNNIIITDNIDKLFIVYTKDLKRTNINRTGIIKLYQMEVSSNFIDGKSFETVKYSYYNNITSDYTITLKTLDKENSTVSTIANNETLVSTKESVEDKQISLEFTSIGTLEENKYIYKLALDKCGTTSIYPDGKYIYIYTTYKTTENCIQVFEKYNPLDSKNIRYDTKIFSLDNNQGERIAVSVYRIR